MDLPRGSLELGQPDAHRCLLFAPGFLTAPSAYRMLLTPVAERIGRVVVVAPAASTVAMLRGRHAAEDQAADLVEVAHQLLSSGVEVLLGGHSRGGLVAYLAAPAVEASALVLVDPVSGGGGPRTPPEPLPVVDPGCPTLVVGCGIGDRCAPVGRNHEVFAVAVPGCDHTVMADCGHADVLDGRSARLGRRLCGGSDEPERARAAVTATLLAHLG
jgi:hypothetical protein